MLPREDISIEYLIIWYTTLTKRTQLRLISNTL